MKKFLLLFGLVLFAASCIAVHFTVNPTFVDVDEDRFAVKIADSWLDKQLSVKEHKVTEAHSYIDKSGHLFINMTYSVKPRKYAFTDWYAGNGEDGGDGWIVEKHGIISWRKIGPFAFTGLACNTGP